MRLNGEVCWMVLRPISNRSIAKREHRPSEMPAFDSENVTRWPGSRPRWWDSAWPRKTRRRVSAPAWKRQALQRGRTVVFLRGRAVTGATSIAPRQPPLDSALAASRGAIHPNAPSAVSFNQCEKAFGTNVSALLVSESCDFGSGPGRAPSAAYPRLIAY